MRTVLLLQKRGSQSRRALQECITGYMPCFGIINVPFVRVVKTGRFFPVFNLLSFPIRTLVC